jgi:hypothetical protein
MASENSSSPAEVAAASSVRFETAPLVRKAHDRGMRHLILLILLTTALSMTACTTEPYHRAFHHPWHPHDDWARDHGR